MNMWYLIIACVAIAAVSCLLGMRTDEKKHKRRMQWFAGVFWIFVVAAVILFIIWTITDSRDDRRDNKAALQELGFTQVSMKSTKKARVSLPGYPIGCRISLKSKNGGWYTSIAGIDYKTPITDASEFTQRKEFIRWCGP